jgi:ATP-dependent DNA ligase
VDHVPGAFLTWRRGSQLLAKREGKDLIYIGKAGTGFTQKMIVELYKL